MIAFIGVFHCVASNVVELIPHKPIDLSVNNNKYIFNNQAYSNTTQLGVVRGSYTIADIPENHPFAFVDVVKPDSIKIDSYDNKTVNNNITHYFGTLKFSVLDSFVSATYACSSHGAMGATDHKFRRMHLPAAHKRVKRKKARSTLQGFAVAYGIATLIVVGTILSSSDTAEGAYKKMADSTFGNIEM